MADKTRTVIGVIEDIERLGNTIDGGPVWKLTMRSGATYRTKRDGTVGYELTPYAAGHHAVLTLEQVGGPEGWVVDDVQLGDEAGEKIRVIAEATFERLRENDRLQPGYYEVQSDRGSQWAYSPDGIGCIWSNTRDDMLNGIASER